MKDARLLDSSLPPYQLGEGASWDAETGRLYWVDILGRAVHCYDPETAAYSSFKTPSDVSFAFASGPDKLLLGMKDGVYRSRRNGDELMPVALLDLPKDHRLNDGKIDAAGRLWVGTICTAEKPTETAALYRLNDDHLVEIERGYVNANGKDWSPDGTKMYHADTDRHTVWQYDHDPTYGVISNKRVFLELRDANPDGLFVHPDGRVFVALYGGAAVDIYATGGAFLDKIALPVPNVTSCVLGGRDRNMVYITTAWDGLDANQRRKYPHSGQMFAIKIG